MADQFSSTAGTMAATDSSNQEHLVSHFSVTEALSEPFYIELTLVSKTFSTPSQLGQSLTVHRYDTSDGSLKLQQTFNGIVTKVTHQGLDANLQYTSYKVELRPWFWLLQHSHNFRVYQNQSTKEIISDILDNSGVSSSYSANSLPSTKREYCLQYNESDYDFVCRLLAEEGIHFYFEHSDGDHQMVLHDAQKPFNQADINKFDMVETPSGNYPVIEKWQPESEFHGASVELTNYDYSQTKLISSGIKKTNHTIANGTKLATRHYPSHGITGDFTDLSSNLVKRRIEQLEQNYLRINATTTIDAFDIATWFSLASHIDTSQLGDFSVIAISRQFDSDNLSQIQLKLVPKETSYYPTPHPKPQVHGLQSAIVAGSNAGDINQDDQGRVRIQFHWDTTTTGDKTSCYVRVAQAMAGNGYGTQFIPRAGHEVMVAFLGGDPDNPVITGSVYNSSNPPPYKESNSTKTGISTKLQGETNELCFDDKQDNEQIYLHAAKDLLEEVENDHTQTIKGELAQTVTKKIAITTDDNYTLAAKESLQESAKTISITADDKIELAVGSSKITLTTSAITIEANSIDIKADNTLSLQGMNVESKATSANKVSGTTTSIEATSSNDIKGMSVSLDAQTTLSAQGQLSAEFKSGLKATFDGGVMGELKGAILKVN